MKNARTRNYNTWPLWNKEVWPVPNWQTVNSWEKEIAYLKSWLKKRIAWMDEQLDYHHEEAGIENVRNNNTSHPIGYYNLQGIRIEKPEKGIVIIRYKDGSSRKVKL